MQGEYVPITFTRLSFKNPTYWLQQYIEEQTN